MPGAQDPIFVPHLTGERTPYCDPSLRGSWSSLALASDRASLLRSALEGTAFAIRDALDALLGPAVRFQEQMQKLATTIPNGNGSVMLLPGLGHVPHVEAPERTIPPLVAFLKEGLSVK